MRDIAKAFENFFEHEHRSIATILSDYGLGRYEAKTEAGHKLIITGDAVVGEKVFYDTNSKKILEKTVSIDFFDIPV